jgi:hypothetical protein
MASSERAALLSPRASRAPREARVSLAPVRAVLGARSADDVGLGSSPESSSSAASRREYARTALLGAACVLLACACAFAVFPRAGSLPGGPSAPAPYALGDETRPVITVGFLSSGDFYWLPIVRLIQAAVPNALIRLTDPTYNWRAMGLDDARGLDGVEVVDGPGVAPDFVVEGPNIFKSVCYWENVPWAQSTAEPVMFFNAWDWCPHDRPATMRLDTGLGQFGQSPLVYDATKTTYVWSPYALIRGTFDADPWLLNRVEAYRKENNPAPERSLFLGFVSGNCQEHRSNAFAAFARAARKNPALRGTAHALGGCNHNHDWSATEKTPPKSTKQREVYARYRWVMAFENAAEPGYVTEKLAEALASGAVPIYYGDSRAARKVFRREAYVDVFETWGELGIVPANPPSREDWDAIAKRVVAIDRDPERYAAYAGVADVLNKTPELETYGEGPDAFEKGTHYPNEPFPLPGRTLEDQTDEHSGATREAVEKLKKIFEPKVREAARRAKGTRAANEDRGV